MKTSLCKSRLNSERAYTTFKLCGKKASRGTLTWTRPGFLGRAKVCARDAPRDRAHTPALA
ncbi:MAG: hypothetical protein WBP52_06865, partial [Terriglobales bacterium]